MATRTTAGGTELESQASVANIVANRRAAFETRTDSADVACAQRKSSLVPVAIAAVNEVNQGDSISNNSAITRANSTPVSAVKSQFANKNGVVSTAAVKTNKSVGSGVAAAATAKAAASPSAAAVVMKTGASVPVITKGNPPPATKPIISTKPRLSPNEDTTLSVTPTSVISTSLSSNSQQSDKTAVLRVPKPGFSNDAVTVDSLSSNSSCKPVQINRPKPQTELKPRPMTSIGTANGTAKATTFETSSPASSINSLNSSPVLSSRSVTTVDRPSPRLTDQKSSVGETSTGLKPALAEIVSSRRDQIETDITFPSSKISNRQVDFRTLDCSIMSSSNSDSCQLKIKLNGSQGINTGSTLINSATVSDNASVSTITQSTSKSKSSTSNVFANVQNSNASASIDNDANPLPQGPGRPSTLVATPQGLSVLVAPPKPPRLFTNVSSAMAQPKVSQPTNDYEFLSDAHSKITDPCELKKTSDDVITDMPAKKSSVEPSKKSHVVSFSADTNNTLFLTKTPVTQNSSVASKPSTPSPPGNVTKNATRWDQRFIRVTPLIPARNMRSSTRVRSKGKDTSKDMFISKKCVNNPSYMYPRVLLADDIIGGGAIHQRLQRQHSEEVIVGGGAWNQFKVTGADNKTRVVVDDNEHAGNRSNNSYESVVYMDPHLMVNQPSDGGTTVSDSNDVMFDRGGYAIPAVSKDMQSSQRHQPEVRRPVLPAPQQNRRRQPEQQQAPQRQQLKQLLSVYEPSPPRVSDDISLEERTLVRSRLSIAYSVLRLDLIPMEIQDESVQNKSIPRLHDTDSDSACEVDLEEHRRRLRHVSTVKHKTCETFTKYEFVKLKAASQGMRLFEYALIVGLKHKNDIKDERRKEEKDEDEEAEDEGEVNEQVKSLYAPVTVFSFPHQGAGSSMHVSQFCFPDVDLWQPVTSYSGDLFSFVLTNSEGERKFGWCLRYLLPGVGARLPEAVCVISPMGEMSLYEHLLRAVEKCRSLSLEAAQELLQVAYARQFPDINKEVYIRTVGPDFKKFNVILKRSTLPRPNCVTFELLLSCLSIDALLQVYSAVLLERKVILCCKQLRKLTSCVFSLVALLYPFQWQHTFITVLPSILIDLVEAPTPFIIGLHSSMLPLLEDCHMNEVLVVNLDTGFLLYKVGDESRIIPQKIQKALTTALTMDNSAGIRCSVAVAEGFMRFFVETCGHYTEYICMQQNDEKIFQRELFVKAVSSRSISMFLEWFTQTQMFEAFITSKLKDESPFDVFQERINDYRQEMAEACSSSVGGTVMAVGKKIMDFFRDSGGKIKKTFQNNVFV